MSSHQCKKVFSHPEKPLEDHLKKVGEIIFVNLQSLPLLLPFPKELFCEIGRTVGFYHDLGKATSFFQEYLTEPNPDRKAKLKNLKETDHSLLSAIAAYFATELLLESKSADLDSDFLEFLPIASFLAIRRHHTGLKPALDDLRLENEAVLQVQVRHLRAESLDFLPHKCHVLERLRMIPDSWPLRKIKLVRWLKRNHGTLPHLVFYLLYSLLLDADKHEAVLGIFPQRRHLPASLIGEYQCAQGFAAPKSDIGRLRNRIHAEILTQLENSKLINNHILSLTAPTGSGKTLAILDFAVKLREQINKQFGFTPRIIYALPFLSIIDQNAEVLGDVICNAGLKLSTDLMLVHHHLSDYSYKTVGDEYGSDESEILIEGWDSEIVITTFVQLFHTLFSNRNRAIRKFNKLVGSIVILDEVQSFPHKYWLLFEETAKSIAKYFNTYFIMVTATQPAIFEQTVELLPNDKEFFCAFDRYQVEIQTEPQNIIDFSHTILKKVATKKRNTLVVLNTIKAARIVYETVQEKLRSSGFETYFLSSHIVPKMRLQRIGRIRSSQNSKAVISTQLVEAGVDIDLDLVIRDFGPLDSINQVAGRANRNLRNTQQAEVNIVCLKDDNGRDFCSYIYDPFLIDSTRRILSKKMRIPESEFLELNRVYFRGVKRCLSDDESRSILQSLRNLNYEEIGRFQLIEEYDKVDIFVEIDEEASTVWGEFVKLKNIEDFYKRRKAFNDLRADFFQYVISVSAKKAAENLPPEVAGIRFVSQAQIAEFYDFETGFIEKGSFSAW